MPLGGHEFVFTDDEGNLLTNVSYEMRRLSDNALANLFSDRTGATPIDNPGTDADGILQVYAIGGAYRIAYSSGGFSGSREYVAIGQAAETDTGATALTSATSLAIGTGTKVFTTVEGTSGWGIGARVRASSDADPTDYMVGLITAKDDNEITLSVDDTGGSGTLDDWTLNIAGEKGTDGAQLDTEDQVLTGGAYVTEKSLGTISSSTVTPDPGDRPLQIYTNGGAHTLAPHGSHHGSYVLGITNNGSAGAITTSGWTKVDGDAFTTTNGHKFLCSAVISSLGSYLNVKALQ